MAVMNAKATAKAEGLVTMRRQRDAAVELCGHQLRKIQELERRVRWLERKLAERLGG